jgi:L-2-hydroxyglutarate oxidase LhgO
MTEQVDCAVIGAGVIGLAVGRALARAGREVLVLEQHQRIGEETSSRNSEVVHAGLYYPVGSLKARLCVEGRHSLYRYCEERQVPVARLGKLIVATDETQLERLDTLARQAAANGVDDIERLDARSLAAREPAVRGTAALWSPSTGIVDTHALMQALEGDLEAADGIVATGTTASALRVEPERVRLLCSSGGEETELAVETVVNAGGLHAGKLAAACKGLDAYVPPAIRYAKGDYFVYRGASPFRTLIYPLPADGGLGIHATLDLAGKLRFGPDVDWIERIDYTVDPAKAELFAAAIRRYWPELGAGELGPGYAGIRPKLSGPGEPAADFRIDLAAGGRARQLVHLFGIESPGLTASLAIAGYVEKLIARARS